MHCEHIDTPNVTAYPRVAPALHHPIFHCKGLFDLEYSVYVVEDRLPGRAKGVTTLVAGAVRSWLGGLENTIVGYERQRCLQVMRPPSRTKRIHNREGIHCVSGRR